MMKVFKKTWDNPPGAGRRIFLALLVIAAEAASIPEGTFFK
jgi:hypothetical protein